MLIKFQIIKIVVLSILVFSALAYAAPCYGPNMPDKDSWDIGAEVHLLLNRDMEKEYGSLRGSHYFMMFSYGALEWLSLDLKLGIGDVRHSPDSKNNINYNANFSGAYGFRIRVYQNETKHIKAIAGFQHISVHPGSKNANGVKNECVMDDWQLSFLISKEFKHLSPYIGCKVSRCDLIHKEDGERGRNNSDDHLGVFLGSDIYINNKLRFNIEGRFIDETALSAALVRRF
ncbi:MAG: hypothetical protein PHQ54_05770 [Candidatus Omnitrophica bacterium]|nr:hypothetical protein [Candidatus Omnitrophota bacterium]